MTTGNDDVLHRMHSILYSGKGLVAQDIVLSIDLRMRKKILNVFSHVPLCCISEQRIDPFFVPWQTDACRHGQAVKNPSILLYGVGQCVRSPNGNLYVFGIVVQQKRLEPCQLVIPETKRSLMATIV